MFTAKRAVAGLIVVILILGTFAGVSLAAGDKAGGSTNGFINGCKGFFGGAADQLTKLLGLEPEQIIEERNAGKSLAEIAKEQGVSSDKVVTTLLEQRKKYLDEQVKAGKITKEQEQIMLNNMKTRIQQRIQDPAAGGGCGGQGCGVQNRNGQGRGGCGMGGFGAGTGACPTGGNASNTSNTSI